MANRASVIALIAAALLGGPLRAAGGPSALDAIARKADAATAAGQFTEAIRLLEAGLRIDPVWKPGLWSISVAAYQGGEYLSARRYLNRLLAIDAKAGAAWALLGLCDFELRDYGAASRNLRHGTALGIPAKLDLADVARFRLASAAIMLQDYDAAEWILLSLCSGARSESERDELKGSLGLAALQIPALNSDIESAFPVEKRQLVRAVGEAMFRGASGDSPGAARLFQEFTARNPKTPLLHYAYATILLNGADYPAAEAELRRELTVDPDSVSARLGLAFVGLRAEDAQPYLPFAQQAVKLKPDSYLGRTYLGRLLFKTDRPDEAAAELEKARDLSPGTAKIHLFLAGAYRALGREADAQRELEEFARLQPGQAGLPH